MLLWTSWSVFTALHQACQHGMFEVARQLVEAGAPLEAETDKAATPLLTASQNGRADIVKLLLSKGVSLTTGRACTWLRSAVTPTSAAFFSPPAPA